MNRQSRDNVAVFVESLANMGRDDPSIADALGITVSQVRSIRREYEITAGAKR